MFQNEQELERQISFHRYKYWTENDPIIEDSEYDQLLESLRKLNPNNKLLQDVEFNYDFGGEKVNHPKPLLSLEKVFSFDTIKNWMKKVARNTGEEFLISPKYDGISAKYYANQNILATRGDGNIGENITNKISILDFETDKLNNNKNITGEIVIKEPIFAKSELRRKDGNKYATPRNLVAGVMNLKDISNLENKVKLTFIEHKKYTFTVSYKEFTENKWLELLLEIDKLKETYPLDGVVIELKDELYSDSLGITAHHPRGKLAYKFENNFGFGKLESVTFSTGKRKLTPVAHITPTIVNGVTIKRVTLHNAKMIIDNDIHIGDTLKVIRSGDVIPYVAGITKGENRKPIRLDKCPYCDSELKYIEPELYCSNQSCAGISSKLLFESVRTLGIDNIGQTSINKFMEHLGVTNILDILTLEHEEIASLDDFGDVSASNIINNINHVVNKIEDYKILACLNIKGVGVTLSKQILKIYSLEELLEISHFELNDIQGIGEIRAMEIDREISRNQDILLGLMSICNIMVSKDSDQFTLGSICFSGTFPKKKEYYKQLANKAGYSTVDSVTKDLSYLVTAGASTSKVNKARLYRIPILKIEDFEQLINKKK